MITRTPKRVLYDKNQQQNKAYYVGNSDSIILQITVVAGAATGALTFLGSAQEKEVDPAQPASRENFFTRVAVNDIDTGKTYTGSMGISVATPKFVMVEVNTRYLQWLAVDNSADNGANVKIDIVTMQT